MQLNEFISRHKLYMRHILMPSGKGLRFGKWANEGMMFCLFTVRK